MTRIYDRYGLNTGACKAKAIRQVAGKPCVACFNNVPVAMDYIEITRGKTAHLAKKISGVLAHTWCKRVIPAQNEWRNQ